MQPHRITDHTNAGRLFACALLTISLFLVPSSGYGERQASYAFTMRVQLKDTLPVSVRNLPEYVRVVSVRDEKGNAVKLDGSVKITKGYTLGVEVREGVDFFRFAKPLFATLYAPVYLGKQVEVTGVWGADMAGKKAAIPIPKDGLGLALEPDGIIAILDQDRQSLDDVVAMTFQGDVLAHAQRIIGMQPVRKRSFELLDRWVSAGEEVRIKVPMPNIDKTTSQLAVGFWTDHPNSAMEEDAYLADITGIEPEKASGSSYIVKAKMPYLGELQHVVPGWYCPYPPTVKMTITARPDENQIISETFDLRVTRRGWGVTVGLLFLFIVLSSIMYVTRNQNPFKEDPDPVRYEKWKDTYKSRLIKRFFFSPLDFAITPFATYSISVAQALFWTFIVAFSCVYVYTLKAAFIVIPEQILILLGIGGGTALAARINATSRDVVPKELMKEIRREEIPRLRDMISIAGRVNIYKFQMMVFTLITGGIVLVELIKACNFPEIPENLLVLMGLSNTLYLGNEVAIEPIKGLREKIKAYKAEKDEIKRKELGDEIIGMFSEY